VTLRIVSPVLWLVASALIVRRGFVTTSVSGRLIFYRLGRVIVAVGLLGDAATIGLRPTSEIPLFVTIGIIAGGLIVCGFGGRRTDESRGGAL
jgi:hypothetical protein